MLDLGILQVKIKASGDKEVQKQLEQIDKSVNEMKTGFSSAGADIKQMSATASKAITAITAAMGAAVATTQRYREDMAKLDTAFESNNKSVTSAKKSYSEFYGILGESDRSVEAVNHLAELTDNEKELAQWSDIAAGVTAKFGDSLPLEGLTEASNETAKVGTVTGVLADALNWAGVNEDAFNESLKKCNNEQERSALITSTLNNLYEETGRQYKERNKDIIEQRKVQAELNDIWAEIGKTVQPVITELMSSFSGYIKGNMPEIIELIETAGGAVVGFFEFVIDNGDTVVTLIVSIGAAFAGWKVGTVVGNAVKAVQAFNATMKTAESVQAAFNVTCSANPYALATAAIGLLVGAVVKYTLTTEKAITETERINTVLEETEKQIKDNENAIQENLNTKLSDIAVTETMVDRLLMLDNELKTNTDNTEANNAKKAELKNLVEQLNAEIPSLKLVIDDETGALVNQSGVVKQLATDYIKLAEAKAYAEAYQKRAEELISTNIDLKETETEARRNYERKSYSLQKAKENGKNTEEWDTTNYAYLQSEKEDAYNTLQSASYNVKINESKIDDLLSEASNYLKTVEDLSPKFSTGNSGGNGGGGVSSSGGSSSSSEINSEYDRWIDEQKNKLAREYATDKISFEDFIKELSQLRDSSYAHTSLEYAEFTQEINDYINQHTAETVSQIQNELNSLNLLPTAKAETANNLYQLWTLQNRNASETEKNSKKVELLNTTIETDIEKLENVQLAYNEMILATGENSAESIALRHSIELLNISIQEAKNAIVDTKEMNQKEYRDSLRANFDLKQGLAESGYTWEEARQIANDLGYYDAVAIRDKSSGITINQTFNTPVTTPSDIENANKKSLRDMEVQLSL